MYNDKLVSIIMPAYNASENISFAIDSVLEQTYSNWELIIVNDCSTDSTYSIMESYSKKDERIKIHSNEKNLKVAKTRNKALQHAQGRYVSFLDSDDMWLPDKLSLQLELLANTNDAYFVYGSYYVVDEIGNSTGKYMKAPKDISFEEMLKGSKIGCLTVLVDRKHTGEFEFKDIGHEDYLLWLELLKKFGRAHGITQPIAHYRDGGGSLSSNKKRAARWQFDIYRKELNIPLIKSVYLFIRYGINAFAKYEDITHDEA